MGRSMHVLKTNSKKIQKKHLETCFCCGSFFTFFLNVLGSFYKHLDVFLLVSLIQSPLLKSLELSEAPSS